MQYRIGQIVEGTITGIQPYGAFVSLDEETSGLIHISKSRKDSLRTSIISSMSMTA